MMAVRAVYLLALACWVGSIVFFSFVGAPSIFKALSREQAGDVVGVIFPKYYAMGTACGLLALACLLILSRGAKIPWLGAGLLIMMLGANIYAHAVVQPQVRALKAEIRNAEARAEVVEPARARFGRLHGFSMILNVVVLAGGVVLIIWTARSLTL